MSTPTRLVALSVALAFASAPAAVRAAEPDPWAGEARERQHEMEELAEAAMLGHLDPDERAEVERYWATHLRRCPMNALHSAQYSIADIQLRRRHAQDAVAALQKVLAGEPGPELRSLTHFNIAEIARRHLRQAETAVKHYRTVAGPLRHLARHYMLGMLVEQGKATEAIKAVDRLIAVAEEKGEKLALLHQLAALYKQSRMPDQALATYQRITKEFTAADIKQMREGAAREARNLFERLQAHAERGEDEPVEQTERRLHERARDLRLARRLDEFEAFRAVMDEGFRRLEEREREEEEREERERDEDEREEERPRRPERREGKQGEF